MTAVTVIDERVQPSRILNPSWTPSDVGERRPTGRSLDAGRAVALLAAHARRSLVTTGPDSPPRGGEETVPVSDEQVVRSAAQMLRGHQPWAT